MSADGSVVVGYGESALGEEAFRWTQSGGMVGLGDNSGSSLYRSRGLGVSADGSTVVGFRNGNFPEAFIWTQSAGMVGLGELQSVPGGFSISWGVSGDGSVVVGSAGFTAFVWDAANGMRSLEQVLLDQGIDLTGWDLKAALAVSADGQTIVGRGIGPAGEEAWIATIPEPSTALLLGLGLLGLGMAGSKPCEPFS
jgi:probable HAF family extracellular repeat protein